VILVKIFAERSENIETISLPVHVHGDSPWSQSSSELNGWPTFLGSNRE